MVRNAWLAALMVLTLAATAIGLAQSNSQEQKAPVNVTGAWVFDVQTSGGGGSPTFAFKQDGEKLEGEYTGLFGTAHLTGTVKGSAIVFSFDVTVEGQSVTITYEGTVESQDSMKGTVRLGSLAEGTFTGKRKAAAG
jgi:hypothetical protein